MRYPISFFAVALIVSSAAAASAQPVNFAGHWLQPANQNDPQADPFGGAGGPGARPGGPGGAGGRGNPQGAGTFGNDFIATQDAKTLTIRRVDTQTNDTLSATFNLDGTESHHKALFGGGYQPAQSVSTAKWEKSELVITSFGVDGQGARIGGATAKPIVTRVWLQKNKLYIQTIRPNNNGGEDSILGIMDKKK